MKATLWLWSLVTVLVCVSQRVSAGPYTDTRIIQPQDNSLVAPAKRTKPSLSIVNPLDVLRQRIILEMARRQMRENTRQVERNKAILREIGKRSHADFRSSDGNDSELRSPGRMLMERIYYPPPPRPVGAELPYLQRYAGSAAIGVDYDLNSREQRKSTGGSSSKAIDDDKSNSPNGKPMNDQISNSGNSGPLTLAKEQRWLEQQEEAEKAAGAFRPQELRYSNDRLVLASNDSSLDDPRRDDGEGDDDDDDDNDEYLAANEDLAKERERLQQRDEKLKSDGYRLRYLNNIQAKMYG